MHITFLLSRCPQFNVCANSSLHDYAKIFPKNNLTVDVDIYQGVSTKQGWDWKVTNRPAPTGLIATPTSGWSCARGRCHRSNHTSPRRA